MSTDPSTPIYQPMKVRSWGVSGRSSLWIGPDHLLQVSSGFVSESYRRWYWRDIQGLVARVSAKRLVWNIIWTVFAVVALSTTAGLSTLAIGGSSDAEQAIFWTLSAIAGFFALVCVAALLANSLLGPTVIVEILTINGPKNLPAITRLRAFRQASQTLRPLIEATQPPEAALPVEG